MKIKKAIETDIFAQINGTNMPILKCPYCKEKLLFFIFEDKIEQKYYYCPLCGKKINFNLIKIKAANHNI